MGTEKLNKKCKAITQKEEDRDKIDFSGRLKMNGEKLVADSLVGKIMLTQGVNWEDLIIALQQAWLIVKELKIKSLRDNIFVFKFASEMDKQIVLIGGLWHFVGALVILS